MCITLLPLMASVHAQSRTKKEIVKLVKKAPRTDNFEFSSLGFGWKLVPYQFVSLKDLDKSALTEVENGLLSKFSDVAFCFNGSKVHHCYWVKDDEGNTGLAKLDGTFLVPPVKGGIFPSGRNSVIVGEQSFATCTEWIKSWAECLINHNGIGIGHFSAVVDDIYSDKIWTIIHAGTYDDIMYARKGVGVNADYYFCAKIINDSLKWGIADHEGKLVIPIEHKAIYNKKRAGSWLIGDVGSGKWQTTEEMDMADVENAVRNRMEIARQRRERMASILTAVGEGLMAAGNTMEEIQSAKNGGTAAEEKTSTVSGGSLESQYKRWEKHAQGHYNSLTNLGSRVKVNDKDDSGTTGEKMSTSNYVRMKKLLREAQQQMRSIRRKASKKGINIPKSEYEDVQVSF